MSISKQTVVRCDYPGGCEDSIVIEDSRAWESRVAARAFGWVYKGEKDLCSLHSGSLL